MKTTIIKSAPVIGVKPDTSTVTPSEPVILSSKTETFFKAIWGADGDPNGKIGICSWNGLHAYWFLTEPVTAQDHKHLPAAFQAYLRQQFVDKETGNDL